MCITATALFDWSAQAPDEHSITVGEIVNLTESGDTYGEGWYEITKDGKRGIIPSNYVRTTVLSVFLFVIWTTCHRI